MLREATSRLVELLLLYRDENEPSFLVLAESYLERIEQLQLASGEIIGCCDSPIFIDVKLFMAAQLHENFQPRLFSILQKTRCLQTAKTGIKFWNDRLHDSVVDQFFPNLAHYWLGSPGLETDGYLTRAFASVRDHAITLNPDESDGKWVGSSASEVFHGGVDLREWFSF